MSRMSAEDKKLVARMKEIRELIAEFGLTLSGYDPGITALLKSDPRLRGDGWGGEPITFNDVEWKWIEPLLSELLEYRRKDKGRGLPCNVGQPRGNLSRGNG